MMKIDNEFTVPAFQPLRITDGWTVSYNNGLYEIDPLPDIIPETERWWIFKEDMLQMSHVARNRVLDLGWRNEGDLENGNYQLVVYEGDFLGELLYEYEGNNRFELVKEIENLLQLVTEGKL